MIRWYRYTLARSPFGKKAAPVIFGLLPLAVIALILVILLLFAAHDVRDSAQYIILYLFWGIAWVFTMQALFSLVSDISWITDALHANSKGALFSVCAAVLGFAMIYSGANVGDGPGWWCVLVAGGMGTAVFLLLIILMNKCAKIAERITVERDIGCAIRFGCFLLASAFILGRASAGDWTSLGRTFVEFASGWPVLPLAALAVIAERLFIFLSRRSIELRLPDKSGSVGLSAAIGVLYIFIAVAGVVLLPLLITDPFYGNLSALPLIGV